MYTINYYSVLFNDSEQGEGPEGVVLNFDGDSVFVPREVVLSMARAINTNRYEPAKKKSEAVESQVLEKIRTNGELSKSKIIRFFQWVEKTELADVLKTLSEKKLIGHKKIKPKRGPAATVFFAL